MLELTGDSPPTQAELDAIFVQLEDETQAGAFGDQPGPVVPPPTAMEQVGQFARDAAPTAAGIAASMAMPSGAILKSAAGGAAGGLTKILANISEGRPPMEGVGFETATQAGGELAAGGLIGGGSKLLRGTARIGREFGVTRPAAERLARLVGRLPTEDVITSKQVRGELDELVKDGLLEVADANLIKSGRMSDYLNDTSKKFADVLGQNLDDSTLAKLYVSSVKGEMKLADAAPRAVYEKTLQEAGGELESGVRVPFRQAQVETAGGAPVVQLNDPNTYKFGTIGDFPSMTVRVKPNTGAFLKDASPLREAGQELLYSIESSPQSRLAPARKMAAFLSTAKDDAVPYRQLDQLHKDVGAFLRDLGKDDPSYKTVKRLEGLVSRTREQALYDFGRPDLVADLRQADRVYAANRETFENQFQRQLSDYLDPLKRGTAEKIVPEFRKLDASGLERALKLAKPDVANNIRNAMLRDVFDASIQDGKLNPKKLTDLLADPLSGESGRGLGYQKLYALTSNMKGGDELRKNLLAFPKVLSQFERMAPAAARRAIEFGEKGIIINQVSMGQAGALSLRYSAPYSAMGDLMRDRTVWQSVIRGAGIGAGELTGRAATRVVLSSLSQAGLLPEVVTPNGIIPLGTRDPADVMLDQSRSQLP